MCKIKILFSLLIFTALNVWGNPYVKLGYANESTDGFGDAGGAVTPWVTFPVEKTNLYAGAKVTSIEVDLNAKATNMYIYIRNDRKDSENLYRQKIGTLAAGHHEIVLDTPFELTGNEPVAIGYKATFAAAKGAAFGQPASDYACHVFYNTKNTWADIRGSFCITAKVEGDNLPANELGITSLSDGKLRPGETVTHLNMMVENLGTETVTSFTVDYDIDSETTGTLTFDNVNIAPGSFYETTLDIPSVGVGQHTVTLTIQNVNGKPDAYTSNNTATAGVLEPNPDFLRRIVVEEGTAEWCSWCPRGIVGMEMMAEKYPEEFIGIALHSRDSYSTAVFDGPLNRMGTLPGCLVNRRSLGDPYFDIENLFLQEQAAGCDIGYTMTCTFEDDLVKTHSVVQVDKAMNASNLYFTFIVMENDLPGTQKNNYSGSDTEMGGWELKPDEVEGYLYQDVARGAAPSYDGEQMLEGTLEPGNKYEFDYSFTLPRRIVNRDKIHIAGMVLDHSNGVILNAYKDKLTDGGSGVDTVADENSEVLYTDVYSIDGTLLAHTMGTIRACTLESLPTGIVIVVKHTTSGAVAYKTIIR